MPECILNECQIADLTAILNMTLPDRRIGVALEFTGIGNKIRWYELAGLQGKREHTGRTITMHHYLAGRRKMPLGVASRLAGVMGVGVELLFECII